MPAPAPEGRRPGKLVVAEGMARELGRISLAEALELTILIARKEPRRLPRVAGRLKHALRSLIGSC